MRIAICEDEELMAEKIWSYFFEDPDIEAEYFLTPKQMLAEYESGKRFDILFCDACMKDMDGITLCKKLREYDPDLYIVFITNYIEYAPLGYEIGLFRYLLKPVTKEMVDKVVQEIREDAEKNQKLLIKTNMGNRILNLQDILYMEVHDKETYVYYNGNIAKTGRSLGELEEQLADRNFFRIHRKYLVNLNRVREFDQFQLTLDNEKVLPISYRRAHEFKSAMYQFLEERD